MYDPNPFEGRHAVPRAPQPYPSYYQPPAPPKKSKAWVMLLVVGILVVGAVIAAVAIGTKGDDIAPMQKDGYYTAADLEPSIMAKFNISAEEDGESYTITDVGCVEGDRDRQWTCNIEYSDGDSQTAIVDVSKDYQSWVSHADN